MTVAAIVVAAGRGERMGGQTPKALIPLAGTPILLHTLRAFDATASIDSIGAVVAEDHCNRTRELLAATGPWRCPLTVVSGGAERQDSVAAGLAALPPAIDLVAVHDGARPFVRPAQIADVIADAARHGAAVLAMPSRDTAKLVDSHGIVTGTPPRESVWLAQTPQVFRAQLLREAHDRARREGVIATDDAALLERLGHAVRVVRGDATNLKITTPDDLRWAEWYLQTCAAPR